MKSVLKDILQFSIIVGPFIYVVFWMNANPWWMALATFLFLYTHPNRSGKTETKEKCGEGCFCNRDEE